MDWKNIFISAILFALISVVVHTIGAFASMDYYMNPAYFPLWSTLMMPGPNPPGTEFYVASFACAIVVGGIFAAAFSMLRKSIPGTDLRKGADYGLLLFILVQIPYVLTDFLLLAVPVTVLLAWALESLIIYVLAGLVFSKLIR